MDIRIIANIISFIGSLLMVGLGLIKRKKNVLIVQCVQAGIMGIGNIMLGGVSGFIVDVVTIIRNIISFKTPFSAVYKIFFIVLMAGLSVGFNTTWGTEWWLQAKWWLGWLPIAGAALFTWFMDTKDDRVIKITCFTGQIFWAVYDFSILNISAGIFDVIAVISNAVGYWRIIRERKSVSVKNDEGK